MSIAVAVEKSMAADQCLKEAMKISGAIGAALVDWRSGMCLGTEGGGGLDLNVAAAGNTEVVRAKLNTMKELGLTDTIEDILITLGEQLHIIRPLKKYTNLFLYVAFKKSSANLATARYKLEEIENHLTM